MTKMEMKLLYDEDCVARRPCDGSGLKTALYRLSEIDGQIDSVKISIEVSTHFFVRRSRFKIVG